MERTGSNAVSKDIKRSFPHIVDVGSHAGHLPKLFDASNTKKVTLADSSRMIFDLDLAYLAQYHERYHITS